MHNILKLSIFSNDSLLYLMQWFILILVDRGDALFVLFIKALAFFLPILLVGPVGMELRHLLCPFGPTSV